MTDSEILTMARHFGVGALTAAVVHELGVGGVACLALAWLMWRDRT